MSEQVLARGGAKGDVQVWAPSRGSNRPTRVVYGRASTNHFDVEALRRKDVVIVTRSGVSGRFPTSVVLGGEQEEAEGVSVHSADPLHIDLDEHERRKQAHGFWSGVAGLLQLRPPRRRSYSVEESLERAFADVALAIREVSTDATRHSHR